MNAAPTLLRLPPGFDEFKDLSTRPLTVSSRQVKEWLEYWWGGVNPDSYLNTLVSSGQLKTVKAPFTHKRMFNTEAVLTWALANGAGGV